VATTKIPGIKEIDKNKYQITIEFGKGAKGKRQRSRHYFEGGIREAVKEKRRLEAEAANEGIANPTKMTVEEYLKWWLPQHAKAKKLADKTVESYEQILEGHLIPDLGEILLTKLNTLQIQEYVNALNDKGLGRTVGYSITLLRLSLKHAWKKYKIIKDNPADMVDLPVKEEPERKAFEGQQMLKFLSKAREVNHRDYRKMVMAFYTGMRRGEIMGLHWEDVDLGGAKLLVRWTLQRIKGKGYQFKPKPKTKAGYRVIELPKTVVDMLQEIRNEQNETKIFMGKKYWRERNLVFCRPNGKPDSPQEVSRRFHRFVVEEGITDFTFHNQRHTNLSLLIADGVDDVTLASHAGHAKSSTSKNMYGHAFEKKKREMADQFEEKYGPKTGQKKTGQSK
jgi:integrase